MRKIVYLFLVPSLTFLIILLFVFSKPIENKANLNQLSKVSGSVNYLIHPITFFDRERFYQATSKTKFDSFSEHKITGGVIPHDLSASFMIADFFGRLAKQNPKTLILIGPNHFEKGGFKALSGFYGWETPFGTLEADDSVVGKLEVKSLIKVDEKVLAQEHSVVGIVPFVKFYLPDTKIVPIILSSTFNQDDARILANELNQYISKDAVVLASVDFSHYLSNIQAQEKDKVTFETIKNFDLRQLFTFNNDYLDSPGSIGLLLSLMEKTESRNVQVVDHTNSGELQRNDFIETTSYYSLAFY